MQPKDRRLVTEQSLEEGLVPFEGRLEGLESLAGIDPRSAVDGQTANMIQQPTTQTREALDSVIDRRVSPINNRANAAHDLAHNTSGRVDALEVITDVAPGNVDDSTIALNILREGSNARRAVSGVILDTSTNLINTYNTVDRMIYPSGSGTLSEHPDYMVSDWIAVVPGEPYTFTDILRVTYFDAQREYVTNLDPHSSDEGVRTFDTPEGAAWARLSFRRHLADDVQMNHGPTQLPYEPWRAPKVRQEYLPGLRHGEVAPENTSFFNFSTNLFDLTAVEEHLIYRAGAGTPENVDWYMISDWISVAPESPYTVTDVVRITCFDANREYVTDFTMRSPDEGVLTVVMPEDTVWVRLSLPWSAAPAVQMNPGREVLPYEEARKPEIKSEYLPAQETSFDVHEGYYTLDALQLSGYYTAPDLEAQPDLEFGNTVYTDVYQWYDQLLADHPSYVTREHIGDSDGLPMYCYRLKMPDVPTSSDMTTDPQLHTPPPAVFLMSGVHGYEKAAIYNLWRFAQALCEEWADDPILGAMRWNFEFVIIPLGNPSAYDQSSRHTTNGVDIARNFPTQWRESEPGTSTYGGPSPMSETETVAIDAVLQSIADRGLVGVSHHNFSSSPEYPERFLWVIASSPRTVDVGRSIIARSSREWQINREWVTNPEPYYGYVSKMSTGGTEGLHISSYGMLGSTFESSRLQYLDGGNGDLRDSRAMTLGYEAFVNYVAMSINAALSAPRPHP